MDQQQKKLNIIIFNFFLQNMDHNTSVITALK